MTSGLDAAQRTALEKVILRCRQLIETDLARESERRFGILTDGTIQSESTLNLDVAALEARRDLESVVLHLRAGGDSSKASVRRLIREAAFTHLNRLVAVRVAEAIGMLPESLTDGINSPGFRDFREIAPLTGSDDWERFRLFLNLCADELARDVPALFDPRNPLLVLQPSTPTFAEMVETVTSLSAETWEAPDTLGWSYQFFNTGDERRAMREASGAPRNSRELAVRNQFFTPRYVVDFLVQNGLGVHLAAGIPELADDLPYLVQPPSGSQEIDLATISVLDPACGSGHFLLGAYDILEQAWAHRGVVPADAAPAIVAALWGIDIDPRCTQIAQAAVVFRARRNRPTGDLPAPNIICARGVPKGPEAEALIASLPPDIGAAVQNLSAELEAAPVLGPLLRIEERIEQEVRASVFGDLVVEGTLAEGLEGDAFTAIENQVLAALRDISDAATSTAAERLFAAEARDAIRFVDAVRRRYTAVLMNPPFGAPVPETKGYLKTMYRWTATKDPDLFAAFVGRGLELSEPMYGTCGAITSRAGMFLKGQQKWRTDVLLCHELVALADLGSGVMEQALVEAAAYVLRNHDARASGTYIRLLRDADRSVSLREACQSLRSGAGDDRVFRVQSAEFEAIPGSPVAYWMDDSIRRLFSVYPPLEGSAAEVRQGLATADDFRFVRTFWEVAPVRIARTRGETYRGKGWVPFAKGGEYSPYWADVHLLVDWEEDGARIKEHVDRRYPYLKGKIEWVVKNTEHYFRRGLTWPRRTNSGFGIRALPAGSIFADKGSAVLPQGSPFELLAWLGSRVVQGLLDAMVAAGEEVTSGGASRSYEVGLVQALPWPGLGDETGVGKLASRLAERRRDLDTHDETTRAFVAVPLGDSAIAAARTRHLTRLTSHLEQLADSRQLEDSVAEAIDLDVSARNYLDQEVGPHPLTYPERTDVDDRIAELYQLRIADVIDQLIEERGGSRAIANLTYFADRRLEVIAHGLEVSPRQIAQVVKERDLLPPEEPAATAQDQASYLVGCAFGRWDIRIASDRSLSPELPDVFDPVPVSSPGELVEDRAPDGYPLSLPPDHVLLDEPGHLWDIEHRTRMAAQVLTDRYDDTITDLASVLNKPSFRHFLRIQFFRDHLSRYSKSRRAAPIYWHLSVPSKAWGVWLYAPTLTRETLFAVVRESQRRERLAAEQIRQLLKERDAGGAGRPVSKVVKALEAEERLAEELRVFRREAERIAQLGWVPDLDDGIVLNAAPFADLFPAWKKAAEYRDELRAGKHEWASVARWADEL